MIWDDNRFPGNSYFVVDGVTLARVVRCCAGHFMAVVAPDAPGTWTAGPHAFKEKDFRTLNAAKAYVARYYVKHQVMFGKK